METLGERIIKLRKELKITQTDIAKVAGVNQSTIGRIENGKILPTADIIIIIADMLNVTCDYLLKGKNANSHISSKINSVIDNDTSLINLYHQLSQHDQKEIIGIINLKLENQKGEMSSTYQNTETHIETA